MYGAATAICSPFSSLVRRSKPVYVTLDFGLQITGSLMSCIPQLSLTITRIDLVIRKLHIPNATSGNQEVPVFTAVPRERFWVGFLK